MKKPTKQAQKEAEDKALVEIAANKKGKYIRVRCWTESCQSSSETHAKSLTAAVKLIRKSSRFHANWMLEFRSEPNAG